MIVARRNPITNRLTDIRFGEIQDPNDLELVEMPDVDIYDQRPWEYDAVNKKAVRVSQPTYDSELNAKARVDAESNLGSIKAENKLLRAMMLTMLDELNNHADKINAILTAIDNGGNLAQVKANILAIPDYPTRTALQLRNAILGKITSGDADN